MTLRRPLTAIMTIALGLVSCSGGDTKSGPVTTTTTTTLGVCAQTTAPADQTITFVLTHSAVSQGVDSRRDSPFSHLAGLVVETPADNTEPLTVTISVLDGATLATFTDVAPGSTCGIDHDFAPGDYFILTSDGNGTQFSSSAADEPTTSAP